jgi:hypothetical protein
MPTVTDSYTMQIQIISHGIASIQLPVIYPLSVEANTTFNITYTVKNTGTVSDTLYGHLIVGGSELTGSNWSSVVTSNATITKTFTHPGINASVTILLEVGHQ